MKHRLIFRTYLQLRLWLCRVFTRPDAVHYVGGSDFLPPPLEPEEEKAAVEALEALSAQGVRCRLLPCACVTAESALLLCFRPDEVYTDGKKCRALIGVSPNRLAPDGEYQAIISQ